MSVNAMSLITASFGTIEAIKHGCCNSLKQCLCSCWLIGNVRYRRGKKGETTITTMRLEGSMATIILKFFGL